MDISIVVPRYNREKHLKSCLISILNQKKLPSEVIIVDNSGHKKAEKIINNVLSKFDSKGIFLIYLQNKENSGATARNLGASRAKGDLIAFLDDDVILDNNYYHEIESVFLTPVLLAFKVMTENCIILIKKWKVVLSIDLYIQWKKYFQLLIILKTSLVLHHLFV